MSPLKYKGGKIKRQCYRGAMLANKLTTMVAELEGAKSLISKLTIGHDPQ
jgi:hypothetical protein